MLSTDKLKNKEVINMRDGRSLGFPGRSYFSLYPHIF